MMEERRKTREKKKGGDRRRRTFTRDEKGVESGAERERERSGSGPLNRQRAEGRRKKDLPWSGKLRDFWISASLVTREAKTVGQVGLGRRKGEGGGSEIEEEEIEYPSCANPFNLSRV